MLKILSPHPPKYRVKRKSAKPRKRYSVINACIMAIAFLCIAIAIPLLLIASPFVLCAVGLLLIANSCNEMRVSEDD
jgi:4-hydroxybenzoate polyprenyltransferase